MICFSSLTCTVASALNDASALLIYRLAVGAVAMHAVTATVIIPADSFQKAACYQGPTGSKESCAFTQDGATTVGFGSTRSLGSGEQMSIVTALNKGAVSVPPVKLASFRFTSSTR